MAARVILTIREGMRAGERHEFGADGKYIIGRGEDCAVNLSGNPVFLSVSRRHCQVELDQSDPHVRDLGSRNGTFLNGMQIGRPERRHLPAEFADAPCPAHKLSDGDELQVGQTIFDVEVCDEKHDEAGMSGDQYMQLLGA